MATTATKLFKSTDYSEYQASIPGTVFQYDEPTVQIEEVVRKFSEIEVEVRPIPPGTKLYTVYGDSHCVVTANNNPEPEQEP